MVSKKEAFKKAISHQETYPVPYFITLTPGTEKKLCKHLKINDMAGFLDNYIVDTLTNSFHGVLPSDLDSDKYTDDFGVVWSGAGSDRGTPTNHPLGEKASLKGYEFPEPEDERRFSHLEQFAKDNSDRFVAVSLDFGLLFERAWYLRGMTNLLMDLYLNPGFVEDLLDSLVEYYVRSIEIIAKFDGIDGIYLVDDYGVQGGLVMSSAVWRKFFKSRLKKIVDCISKHNLITHLHSCGNVTEIVGDLVESGVQILDPIQPEAMDAKNIKRNFGEQITLLGGLSSQKIIPCGTKEQVTEHVIEALEVLGKGGGYVAGNGVPLQTDVPLENLLALMDVLKNQ